MPENAKPNNERPADLAVQDSVGGMARRLLNPAHLRDLAGRSVRTLREQGAEQLWRDVKFRVGLAMHHDDWRHRADIPLRRELKSQRAAHLQGPKVSIIVPDEYMGDVIGDISGRRGSVRSLEARNGAHQIDCDVPLSEMFGYATNLRSRTQGRGQFSMEPSHYVELSKNLADEVIKKRRGY